MRFRGMSINLKTVYNRLISGLLVETRRSHERRYHREMFRKWFTGKRADLRDLNATWLENTVKDNLPPSKSKRERRRCA